MALAVWETPCVICGAEFQVATPPAFVSAEQSKSFLMTTCPAHRMTPSETGQLRRAKVGDGAALFEQIRCEKVAAEPRFP
jgi:hypothetical protein